MSRAPLEGEVFGPERGDEAEEARAILTRRLPGFPDTVPTPLAATGENA